jgi:putative acetyltransferase
MSIAVESPREPGIDALIEGSTRYAHSLGYPPETCFLLDLPQLEQPGARLYVARDEAGRALGMAAIVDGAGEHEGRGELKRMFVDDEARGLGVGARLIERIETDAASRGIREIVLETGTLHLPAQALYAKHGYRRVEPFGPYVGKPYSLCMAKSLLTFDVGHLADEPLAVAD